MVPTSRSLSTRRLWFRMATLASLLILPLLLTASLALAQTPAGGGKAQVWRHPPCGRTRASESRSALKHSFLPHNIGTLIYNGLVRLPYGHEQKDPYDLTIMPDLAERWEYTDNKTVVFYLRQGVKFHNKPPVNGREVRAQDVKFSLERFAAKSGFGPVSTMSTVLRSWTITP